MLKKLSTFFDRSLERAVKHDATIGRCQGFQECLTLGGTVVGVAFLPIALSHEWRWQLLPDEPGPSGNRRRIARMVDRWNPQGNRFMRSIDEAERVEVTIALVTESPGEAPYFAWKLCCYRTSRKVPFYELYFSVTLEGVVRTPSVKYGV